MTSEPKRSDPTQAANDSLSKPDATRRESPGVIAIWDIWTRLFHWSLVVAVLFLFLSGETGFKFYEWHRLVGEFVLMLLVFRILWGLIGSSNIRFAALIRNPVDAVKHLVELSSRKVSDERGHNAAGSWAIIIMLLLLLTQAVTGLFIADEDELIEGALYGQLGSDLSYFLYRVHHFNAQLLMIIVGIHVVMILVYAVIAGKNLLVPMFTGKMQWTSDSGVPAVNFKPWWLGALCLLVAAIGVNWLVGEITGLGGFS